MFRKLSSRIFATLNPGYKLVKPGNDEARSH